MINYNEINALYKNIFNKITSINFKIAGNIDKNLVQILHNYLKENIRLFWDPKTCKEENDLSEENNQEFDKENESIQSSINNNQNNQQDSKKDYSYIIDYYQKSTMPDELDGAIFIIYRFDDEFKDYMDVFKGCLENIGKIYLRFEYSHAYHPKVYVENNFLMIFEQGRYREPIEYEDEINEVIFKMLKGEVKCHNYKDIVKSYKMKNNEIKDKSPENLFNGFISRVNDEGLFNDYSNVKFPKTFLKLMKKLSPIFTQPKRYTILVSRYDLPDNEFNEMMKRRKETAKYILNENIRIYYTDNIELLKPK
jgi:hypothetical protein